MGAVGIVTTFTNNNGYSYKYNCNNTESGIIHPAKLADEILLYLIIRCQR